MKASTLQAKFIQIRSNKLFEIFVVTVIIFSALLVGVKTYDASNTNTMVLVTKFLDWFISAFFLTEISIRFLAEHRKGNFFKSFWNIFDTLIVIISLIPADNTELALVARLVRVFRLGYVMLLMFIIFYIYAAVGSTLFGTINPVLWGDITISLLTLFRVMTFEDWTDVMYETMEVYPLSWIFYLSFIFFTAFAFLNMVIGIVVNVMEQENAKARAELMEEEGEPSLKEISEQISKLQAQILSMNSTKIP
jgi:voltage-gated sodium channel